MWLHLPANRPSVQSILNWAEPEGGDGGISSMRIDDWRAEVGRYLADGAPPLAALDQSDIDRAREDYRATL